METNNFIYHTPDLWESKETAELDKALVAFNLKFNAVGKDSAIQIPGRKDKKYASLDTIMIAVRPLLAECGLFVQQPIAGDKVVTIIRHTSGQFRAASMTFAPMSGNGTNALQNAGGGFTYIKRYAISAILSLATEEDDDGQSGTIKPEAKATKPPIKPPVVEKVTDEKVAIKVLESALSIEDLGSRWFTIAPATQALETVKTAKEVMKVRLSTPPRQEPEDPQLAAHLERNLNPDSKFAN